MARTEIWVHAKDYTSQQFYKLYLMIETNIIMLSYIQDNASSGEDKGK